MCEVKVMQRVAALPNVSQSFLLEADDLDCLGDAPEEEVEAAECAALNEATAAITITELKAEIESLRRLQQLVAEIRRTGSDTKWCGLSKLLRNL